MDTTDTPSPAPPLAVAGLFLEALTAGDFKGLSAALDDDASLAALLPGGFREWQGAPEIVDRFEKWFGDVDEYEVVDASTGQVGSRLQLRWRIRLRGTRFGVDAVIVEQQAYIDTAATGRITSLSLLCSGYCQVRAGG